MTEPRPDLSQSTTGRHCREIDGPKMTTLGMLLWEKVTLDVDFVLQLFINICDLLKETHKQGYAVGTLHPEGIMLVVTDDTPSQTYIKRSGIPCGIAYTDEISLSFDKSTYLSPEQLDGLSPSPCSDIYAIGCMLHTALAGTPPVTTNGKKDIKLLTRKGQLETVYEHKLVYLKSVIKQCLHDDEAKRYRSAADLKIDLVRIQRGIEPRNRIGKKQIKFPFLKKGLLTIATSMCMFLWLASVESINGQTEPTIQGVWNKAADAYEYGDEFSITLKTKQKCYAYLFYINEDDSSLSLYPARYQGKNIVSVETPLAIDRIEKHLMKVDGSKGELIIVSIATTTEGKVIKERFLSDSDWSPKFPTDHCLSITGAELKHRLESLRNAHPDLVFYSVEEAPRAKPTSERINQKRPMRIEVSYFK